MDAGAIVGLVIAIFVVIVVLRSVRIVPQARAGVVERLGRYSRTLTPGLSLVMPGHLMIKGTRQVISSAVWWSP